MTTAVLNYFQEYSIPHVNINWKAVCLAGFVLLSISLVFYAYQINNLTRGYYLINNYQNKITDLSKQNNDLQVSFAESSFLAGVLQKAQDMDFQRTAAGSVKYIQVVEDSVAIASKVK